jgi:hypothetical protein
MSTIFKINKKNGFLISGGNIKRVHGLDAVVINCQHEAQTLKGEDPFRQGKGMPNFTKIWNGTPDLIQFEFHLRKVLLAVSNVDRVSNFEARMEGNKLIYSVLITTPFGSETVTGNINA